MTDEEFRKIVSQARPLKDTTDGLAAMFFVRDQVAYSYYRSTLLSTPALGMPDFCVDGDSIIRAAAAAKGNVKFSLTEQRLTITSGKVKNWLPLYNDKELPILPQPTHFTQVSGDILPTLKELAKLVPEEAPRAWGTSLLLRGDFGYATDSQYMVRVQLGVKLPFEVALPKACVTVLARLAREPVALAFEKSVLTFTFADNSYLQTPVLADKWPDVDGFFNPLDYKPVSEELLEVLEQIKPYGETGVHFDMEVPNKASFNTGTSEASIVFDSNIIECTHSLQLKTMIQFFKSGVELAHTDKFVSIKDDKRIVILALKKD